MPRQAKYLYKAKTGSFPTSGASLKTALGAASGDHTSYWNTNSWSDISGDVPNDGVQKASGYTWLWTKQINVNSKATDIMRSGAALTAAVTSAQDGQEANLTTNSVSLSGTPSASVGVQTKGKLVGTTRSYHVWYDGYSDGVLPPDDAAAKDVRFNVQLTLTGGGTPGYTTLTFDLSYVPDNGPYNPTLTTSYTTSIQDRIEEIGDFQHIEWHSNSSYTSLLQDGDGYVVSCPYGGTVNVYLRLWRDAWNAWVNIGLCTFTDERGGL